MANKKQTHSDIIKSIRGVLRLEAATLEGLSRTIGIDYARAVTLLARCRGKVIVTGIGKSGIIAQKIAATLASTGTPALYMHPAEGLHGDLGLVEKKDLILALGKSGESAEINAMIPTLKALGVKIIALTANPRSTLAKNAEVVLATPIDREACPLNLAPTCSTTAALAVGDALAVTLMKKRGFRKEHFARLHPGGRLGRQLTVMVDDVMRKGADNPTIRVSASVNEMLVEITRKHAGAISIVDGKGKLIGLVTDYDIRREAERSGDVTRTTVRKLMNPKPTRIRAGKLAIEAVELMDDRSSPFNVLPVVDAKGRAVGMIQIHDLRTLGF